MGVIPGGCTKFLQTLDVSIKKPFKMIFRDLYDESYRKGEFEYTKGGKPSNYVCKFGGLSMLGRKLVLKLSRNHSKHVALQQVTSTKSTV